MKLQWSESNTPPLILCQGGNGPSSGPEKLNQMFQFQNAPSCAGSNLQTHLLQAGPDEVKQ